MDRRDRKTAIVILALNILGLVAFALFIGFILWAAASTKRLRCNIGLHKWGSTANDMHYMCFYCDAYKPNWKRIKELHRRVFGK